MSDNQPNNSGETAANRTLSEISHLFLSSVRDKQAGGAPRPQRTPPRANTASRIEPSTDLTPEEFAQVVGAETPGRAFLRGEHPAQRSAASAVLAAHLNGHQRERVREYAAHLCKSGQRIGLIEIDAAEFRVSFFELGRAELPTQPTICDVLDARMMSEALEELSWDVDRWILNVPNPRLPEARSLLGALPRWSVLATCDHDGVVACYRSLKGLSDLHRTENGDAVDSPVLSLALLGVSDEMQSMRVFRKLAGVCQQFLHWPLESEAPVLAAGSVIEHQVLICRASRDKAQLATAPQWQIVGDFLNRSRGAGIDEIKPAVAEIQPPPVPAAKFAAPENPQPASSTMTSDVFDLPAGAETPAAIVAAIMRGGADLVECPVKPPMLEDASLAVARDRRLVMLAVAKQGLADLRNIGEAWRWMNENRALIAMAVPQLSIDPHQLPHLRLLIDRADLSAATLQPLLQTGNVTVQTYRKLRWGAKTGLLLEAA